MDRKAFIAMLNKDMADEHASIIRYLIHAYQVGESTPFGQMLLSTAREEMWHMDWLGDELGEMGEEPGMEQGIYPYDGTSNASLLRSYIEWEDNLIKMYDAQAAQVDEPELKRVLHQLGWESITHRRRFASWLDKLGSEGEKPLAPVEGDLSPDLVTRFHSEVDAQYKLVLQHLRHAFVLEGQSCPVGSELELTAMRHMKNLSHFAEELIDSGEDVPFSYPGVDQSSAVPDALAADLRLTTEAQERFIALSQDPEVAEHPDLKIEIDNLVTRNGLLTMVVKELLESVRSESGGESSSEAVSEPEKAAPEAGVKPTSGGFTVGSLKGH
ncbi:MAG: ferritin-like domain-containing protein [Anaerolineae bacterium]|jgi:bacterioferritin|nr:ferritin-like domain-containing protein [Anaerolineae bacterium]